MSSFKDRQTAFENKYAHDQDMLFKIEARTSKLFGLWAGEQLGLGPEDAKTYAAEMVGENLVEAGYDDIKRKAVADFTAKGVSISEHVIDTMIEKCMADAQAQIESEVLKTS